MSIRKLRNEIGRKVRKLRLEHELSQEKFAECTQMSREHVSCIERGKNLPTVETLYYISNYFKIDIKYFF